ITSVFAPIATLLHIFAPSTDVFTINITLSPISGVLPFACPIITLAEMEKFLPILFFYLLLYFASAIWLVPL
ncbi:hypothetical protein, partial [Klebsiella pneumoniae]|uniref:hypothetical protein n=1 Tax=Klebsiella pneumoniae TaxID=573 RepID=UPI0022CD2EAC